MNDALGLTSRTGGVGDEREVVVPRVSGREVLGAVRDEAVPVERVRRNWAIGIGTDDDVSQTGTVATNAVDDVEQSRCGDSGDGFCVIEPIAHLRLAELRTGRNEDAAEFGHGEG